MAIRVDLEILDDTFKRLRKDLGKKSPKPWMKQIRVHYDAEEDTTQEPLIHDYGLILILAEGEVQSRLENDLGWRNLVAFTE